ncbi:hypothetical protein [Longimicrobium sp.]|uniref:type II toxin-antitoxin system Phd/YefM family antitoxin n=1 Tax=Longimicrobium sp. TaxID=2029185 RepID=UPI002E31DF98|nr:hypothetical protein [Longimicrobium sp.]HEX6042450.1 hypothetical protein [Longimicrobium sp.]
MKPRTSRDADQPRPSLDVGQVPGLAELLRTLDHEGEILLVQGGEPVARIVPVSAARKRARKPGSARGLIHVADDFDAMPKDLQPYF